MKVVLVFQNLPISIQWMATLREAGRMIQSFEDAIASHAENEIFTLDVPSNDWYYIILKTYPERIRKKYALLKITDIN